MIAVLAGFIGAFCHCLLKMKSLKDKSKTANLEFKWQDYPNDDYIGIILSFLVPVICYLLFGEISTIYPKIAKLEKLCYFSSGLAGSYLIQTFSSVLDKKIKKQVDWKTDVADGKRDAGNFPTMVLLMCASTLFLWGCSNQAKLNRAVNIVSTSKPAFDSLGRKWSKLNPCINDTTPIYIEGKTVLVKGKDSAYPVPVEIQCKDIDTTIFFAKSSWINLRIKDGGIKKLVVNIPEPDIKTRVDTVTNSIKDTREIKLLEEDKANLKDEISKLKYSISLKDSLIANYESERKSVIGTWRLYQAAVWKKFWWLFLLLVAGSVFIIYKRFKK